MRKGLLTYALVIGGVVCLAGLFLAVGGFDYARIECPGGNDCEDATGTAWGGLTIAAIGFAILVPCALLLYKELKRTSHP
jgi:hypothetical protein